MGEAASAYLLGDPLNERTPIMALLAEQVEGERMARIVLSMLAEPNDPTTGHVLAHTGGVETLRMIESDDAVPGLARADAMVWRERLATRLGPELPD